MDTDLKSLKQLNLNYWQLLGDCGPKINRLLKKGYYCLVVANVSAWESHKIQQWFKEKSNSNAYLSKRIFFHDSDIGGCNNCELLTGFPTKKQAKKFETFLKLLPKRSFKVIVPNQFEEDTQTNKFGVPTRMSRWLKKNISSNYHVFGIQNSFVGTFDNEEDATYFILSFS